MTITSPAPVETGEGGFDASADLVETVFPADADPYLLVKLRCGHKAGRVAVNLETQKARAAMFLCPRCSRFTAIHGDALEILEGEFA